MKPTTEQIAALAAYQAEHGRNWKFKLCIEWMNGTTTGLLQEVRNQLGPNWLANYRPAKAAK